MKKAIICYLLLGGSLASYCQSLSPELLSSSGGYNLIGDVRMHWAIGEVAVEEHRNGIRLTEGFFQAYADAVTDVPELFVNAEVAIWPNPTAEIITISHELDGELKAYILSVDGALIEQHSLTSTLSRISLADFMPSTYFIRLVAETGEQATYSIIKL